MNQMEEEHILSFSSVEVEDKIQSNKVPLRGPSNIISDQDLVRMIFDTHSIDGDSEEPSESSGSLEESMATKPAAANDNDEHQELIRQETKTFRIVRSIILVLILCAAAASIACTYMYTSSAEQNAFETTFDDTASKILEAFLFDTRIKINMARTTATTLEVLIDSNDMDYWNFSTSVFDEISIAERDVSFATMVSWAPFLRTTNERSSFENAAILIRSYPPCYFCGSEEFVFTNPNDTVTLPSFEQKTCQTIYDMGRNRGLSPEMCLRYKDFAKDSCFCSDKTSISEQEADELFVWNVTEGIFKIEEKGPVQDDSEPPYSPIWLESSRDSLESTVLFNQLSEPVRRRGILKMVEMDLPVMSEQFFRTGDLYKYYLGDYGEPGVLIFYPVHDRSNNGTVIGVLTSEFSWKTFIKSSIYPPKSELIDIVIENTCGQSLTYRIENQDLRMIGQGNIHNNRYTAMGVSTSFDDFNDLIIASRPSKVPVASVQAADFCRYRFTAYPTQEFEADHVTNKPIVYAITAASFFVFMLVVFGVYDFIVVKRQSKTMEAVQRSTAIVSSLFPKTVRERLYQEPSPSANNEFTSSLSRVRKNSGHSEKQNALKSFLEEDIVGAEPIADSFAATTVMFLDIAGFTAWSSEREPTKVFKLLETIYQKFDELALKLGVFKVETIGDCYVAVSGVPEPREDHAIVMARFSNECLKKFNVLAKHLEVELGPSTADLRVRIGLHSGPVTAGVIRGQKARFQLFGDTMNTAARMESTGLPGRIQVSQKTADLLVAAGKREWTRRRPDLVDAKGKGFMQTYWLEISRRRSSISSGEPEKRSCRTSETDASETMLMDDADLMGCVKLEKNMRLIEWNVEVLYSLLKKVVASRNGRPRPIRGNSITALLKRSGSEASLSITEDEARLLSNRGNILDEVAEFIEMPHFDPRVARLNDDENVNINSKVRDQLHEYIMRIAGMHHNIPFHNFERASHVAMSASKLLRRILNPANHGITDKKSGDAAKEMHSLTYGISSDPLMQFAIVFSALIQNVDHSGVNNATLNKLKTPASVIYKNRSVSQQNALHLAWSTLMDEDFYELRSSIYTNTTELRRFRQLVVNGVLATDVLDPELNALRQFRWDHAFASHALKQQSKSVRNGISDRKATIVLEYILQAADHAHTMQHWQTFSKWNQFDHEEAYIMYLAGKEDVDPSVGWYETTLAFFDDFAIPLAKKLNSCEAFGNSGDEFITLAEQNRSLWEQKGESLVTNMKNSVMSKSFQRKESTGVRRSAPLSLLGRS